MEETLRYIYTGKVNDTNSSETWAEVMRLAHYLGIEGLKELGESALLKRISVDNAIQLYSLSKDMFSIPLAKAAIDFIKRFVMFSKFYIASPFIPEICLLIIFYFYIIYYRNKQAVVSQSEEFHKLTAKYPTLMFELFMSS